MAELVPQIEGRDSPAESKIKGIQGRLRLICARVGRVRGIAIDRLSERVVGLESQAMARALNQGDVQ